MDLVGGGIAIISHYNLAPKTFGPIYEYYFFQTHSYTNSISTASPKWSVKTCPGAATV